MFSINFSKVEIPELKETKAYRGNYYMTGADNNFFNELIYLYEQSSMHNTFINNLKQKSYGTGLIAQDTTSETIINNMQLNKTFSKVILDYVLFGGYSLEVIWNALHTKILEINYIDFSKIRSGYVDKETDEVELYYYSYDWKAYHKNITTLQKFNIDDKSDNRQIYYYKSEFPGTDIYPRPYYLGGLKYIYTDIQLSKYYANLVKNNFVGNTIINIPDGATMDEDKREKFEKGVKENFTDPDNAAAILVTYDTAENGIQLLEFGKDADDKKYQWISQFTNDQIIIAHNIPNPIIAGVRIPGTLGGTQEMMDAENIYNVNMVIPTRNQSLAWLEDMNNYLMQPVNYTIENITVINNTNEQ